MSTSLVHPSYSQSRRATMWQNEDIVIPVSYKSIYTALVRNQLFILEQDDNNKTAVDDLHKT